MYLKVSEAEAYTVLADNISPECTDCNMRMCVKSKCVFRNGTFSSLFTFGQSKKHWIYYFIYHPELHWEFPKRPDKYKWHLHHIDGDHYNDAESNHELISSYRHMEEHGGRRSYKSLIKVTKAYEEFQKNQIRKQPKVNIDGSIR